MFSRNFFVSLLAALLTLLTAAPALAQTADEPPDNPSIVDVPPDNPELASDKPLYLDPRLSILLIGLDDQVTLGGAFGLDFHVRLRRHHSLAAILAWGGSGQLNDYAEGDRLRYMHAYGLAYAYRAHLDTFRFLAGAEFLEVRDTAGSVILNGGAGALIVEAGKDRWLGRLAIKLGAGWDWLDDEAGFLYSAEASVLYSF